MNVPERGHEINVINDWSWIVVGESGAVMAGTDPRRDGYALAV